MFKTKKKVCDNIIPDSKYKLWGLRKFIEAVRSYRPFLYKAMKQLLVRTKAIFYQLSQTVDSQHRAQVIQSKGTRMYTGHFLCTSSLAEMVQSKALLIWDKAWIYSMCHVFFLFLIFPRGTVSLKLEEEKIKLTRFLLEPPLSMSCCIHWHVFTSISLSLSLEEHGSEHFTVATSCLELN